MSLWAEFANTADDALWQECSKNVNQELHAPCRKSVSEISVRSSVNQTGSTPPHNSVRASSGGEQRRLRRHDHRHFGRGRRWRLRDHRKRLRSHERRRGVAGGDRTLVQERQRGRAVDAHLSPGARGRRDGAPRILVAACTVHGGHGPRDRDGPRAGAHLRLLTCCEGGGYGSMAVTAVAP